MDIFTFSFYISLDYLLFFSLSLCESLNLQCISIYYSHLSLLASLYPSLFILSPRPSLQVSFYSSLWVLEDGMTTVDGFQTNVEQ